MNKKKALGRGLSALVSTNMEKQEISSATARRSIGSGTYGLKPELKVAERHQQNSTGEKESVAASVTAESLELSRIKANPEQPRKSFNDTAISELAASIAELGVIQPLVVRKNTASGDYTIVAGERRFRAATEAGLKEVPVIIREMSDQTAMEVALVENIQRSDLNPLEEGQAYQALIEEFGLSQQQVSKRTGKSRSAVANYVRLLSLPVEVQKMVKEGILSMGHAKAIMSVKEPKAQINLANKIIKEKLSVRAIEDIVGTVVNLESRTRTKSVINAMVGFSDLENKLKNQFATKVRIKQKSNGKGQVTFDYYSSEEFSRLIDILLDNN